MTEDERTIYCGNLSEKVTDDILYELFLQGGPLEKINIPKDREGKQRTFAFITYKHKVSVWYAISLFDGTFLYNRAISLKSRNNIAPPEMNHTEQNLHQSDLIQLGKQMLQCMPNSGLFNGCQPSPPMLMNPNNLLTPPFNYNEDRRSYISHPYHREPERHNKNRYNDHGRDNRRDYYSSQRDNHRDNSHRSNRHESNNRHESGSRHESGNRHDRRYYRS